MSSYTRTTNLNRTSISKTVSEHLGVDQKLTSLASGLISPGDYVPTTKHQYAQFRRFLHDIFCLSLIDNGLFQGYELNISDLSLHSSSKRLRNQKPDLYKLSGKSLHIGELTCTYSPETAKQIKHETYKSLVEFYRDNDYEVTFSILVVNLSNPEWDLEFPKISQMFMDIVNDLMDCLRQIHSNPLFNSMRKEETGFYAIDKMAFSLEDETLIEEMKTSTGEDFSKEDIHTSMIDDSGITDEEYIDSIAMSIINDKIHPRPKPRPAKFYPKSLVEDFQKLKSLPVTTTKKPRILQLGMVQRFNYLPLDYPEFISQIRQSSNHGGYLTYIKSSLERENLLDDHLITLPITTQQLEKEQAQGPGRKTFLKKHGIKITRDEPKHIGLFESHEEDLLSMIDDIKSIRCDRVVEVDTADSSQAGLTASTLLLDIQSLINLNSTTAVLQFYQLLSREITLNSMRRRKTRQYALGYSGVEGVLFLIAPGPQLRTESNVEFVKLISTVEPFTNPYSAPWHSEGDHWESDWLSVDIDRLKQWQRAYDRVSLSTLTNSERLVRPGTSLKDALKEEISSGNYSFLALTFLEDKQLTSTTNQTLRYLWMKSIGDKDFDGLMSKFPTRVNSIIQSVMLQRSFKKCIDLCNTDLSSLITIGRVSRDSDTGNYDESTTGVLNLLPRLFTFGPPCTISYNLNEIYWCVSYNKDRQNQTQDSMNILNKILKEEDKYNNELNSRNKYQKLDYVLGKTTLNQDIKHIRSEKPESHYYSRKAVSCGIRLQDTHPENQGDHGSWLTNDKLNSLLSKNLSEYATFKASVKTICEQINPQDLEEVKKIGNRTKAIELVAELVQNEKLVTALDVVMSYSGMNNQKFEVTIQIFKKNQIGGVREIIILFIKARILFNIVEEISRLLSKSDRREILTKGRDKRLMMRADYEDILSKFRQGTPVKMIKESYDMTTWAQKFIPTIFIPIYEHHFKDFKPMSDLAKFIFLKHTNKRMEYPKKLIQQWIKYPETKYKEAWLNSSKDKFLTSGNPWFYNHSNMCQGIPHYNSTVLALSCLSLRDALFKSCLRLLNAEQSIHWKTRAGSDDKGTIIGLDMSKADSYKQYVLLGQCERASERLHSMELSVKSASGHIMYELNSAFMANLETLSPTIKFSLAATDMIGTSSCTNFINESFGRIRQLRENGASSVICSFAHSLNSHHFYEMFSTGKGSENDLTKIFNVRQSEIPYDFGVYPTYDIDIQDIVGPEFYNYNVIKRNPSSLLVKLLYTSISADDQLEMFPTEDTPLLKKDHFGISQGMVRQLKNMRSRLNCNPEEISNFFVENPFIIVRGPETALETKYTILSKLYTKGASEALRRTSPAIYVGRLSAFKNANAWTSPDQMMQSYDLENGEIKYHMTHMKTTYSEFLKKALKVCETSDSIDVSKMIPILFPQHNSFEVIRTFAGKFGATRTSMKKYSQSVRSWTVNNFNYEFTSSLKSIIETSFGQSHQSSIEDVNEMRSLVKMNLTSLEDFAEQCKSRSIRPLEMFYYMVKLHKNSKTTKIQAFGNGPSTTGLHMTIMSIKKFNHIPGTEVIMDHGVEEDQLVLENSISKQLDNIKLFYNLMIMNKIGFMDNYIKNDSFWVSKNRTLEEDCLTTIRSIKSITGYDLITQKTLKLVATELLEEDELKEKLISWKTLNYTYLKKQKRTITETGHVQWTGDLSVLVSSENECFTINEKSGHRYLVTNRVNDIGSIYRSLKEMSRTLDLQFNSFFTRKTMKVGDYYLSQSTKMIHESEVSSSNSNVLNLMIINNFPYKRLNDLTTFKVVTNHNKKTGEIQVFLSDREKRTSTICHSNGNYYPVEIPRNFCVADSITYLGVRLSRLLINKSWFYNYRLPIFSQSERLEFIKNDINLEIVMGLEDRDRQRINDYIEVREEVNEESFGLNKNPVIEIDGRYYEPQELTSETIAEIFNSTMQNEVLPDSIIQTDFDWYEDVIEEEEYGFQSLKIDDEEAIGVIKSIGYKKPKQRKAMHTISGLQQGGLLKSRILDLFFTSQNIKNERVSQLPHMYLWVKSVNDRINPQLCFELKAHIIKSISSSTGATKARVQTILESNSTQYHIPIQTLDSIINNRSSQEIDMLDQILEEDRVYDDLESQSEASDAE
ncbi:RNA-dependent RNA polymerase [Rice dwarf-associated bunya-like virus]|uniref:RNA-directed RNA polymerase L n=1 Tax=Rice dwarf-associated bunya-like virus TaxID=2963305 RepID=A0AAE9MRF8_9VIRU|nr:RNA-dependent RNA polymerase [Rice dwarf-associated bunya-like virus]